MGWAWGLMAGWGVGVVWGADQPNVVVILADDMGYGDVGCNHPGGRIATPALDRLAREGMRFTDAHAAGGLCVPSRYGLLTGNTPPSPRADGNNNMIPAGTATVASVLRGAGYRTAMVGKWHNHFEDEGGWQGEVRGGPVACGFDYFFGLPHSLDIEPYFYLENDRVVAPPSGQTASGFEVVGGGEEAGWNEIQGPFWRAGRMAPGFRHEEVLGKLFEKAQGWLGQGKGGGGAGQPFFLYLALTGPHTPWLPGEAFQGRSGAGSYGDFVMEIDHRVGGLLDWMEGEGMLANTLVIFTSDNGPVWFDKDVARYGHDATGPWRGAKADVWEAGHRVPFLAWWRGRVPAGKVSPALIGATDILRTLAEAAGAEVPAGAGRDSVSFLPVLLGQAETGRQSLLHQSRFPAWRQGNWKYIAGPAGGGFAEKYHGDMAVPGGLKEQLYDLSRDPGERDNLAAVEPAQTAALRQALEAAVSTLP